MVDRSLFSLFSEEGKAAYSRLLDRDENSPGGGDVGASIRWPSSLLATPDHRIVAAEMDRVLGGTDYDWAYVGKYGGDPGWSTQKAQDRAAFESWVQDYDQSADRLAGLPPGSNSNDPGVLQTLQDFYQGVWPGVGFPVPGETQEPGFERDSLGRVLTFNEWAPGSSVDRTYDLSHVQPWSQQTIETDAQGHTDSIDTRYDNGSRTVAGFNDAGQQTWEFDRAPDGSGSLTDGNGTTIDFDGSRPVEFSRGPDGSPQLTFGPGDGGPEVTVGLDPNDGSTTVGLDGGTPVSAPAGSQVSVDSNGMSADFADPGSSGSFGFGRTGDDSGPDDPEAPFEPNHPNPLQSRDPLVLDLNGNGIELTDVRSSNAHFDYGGTGFAVHTGWFAPTEGILIRDIDHNSSVTADELFGAVSGNALEDLAAFDANQDGRIDSNDSVFGDLKIWQDANGDGIADPGELISLAAAGVRRRAARARLHFRIRLIFEGLSGCTIFVCNSRNR